VIGPGETVTIYDIPAGTKVDLLASPDEGYEFVEWVGKPIDGVTTPVVTITVQGYYEITANFELIPTYELTMAASPLDSGTTTDLTNEAPYAAGTNVSIKAEANEGYQFVNWIAPAGEFDNADEAETTSTMPGEAVTITANFELIPTYELTMAADPELGGTAIDVTDESPYAEGTQVSIRAEANPGYRFVNWTSTAGGFDNADEAETTFTMPGEAVTITANFEVIPMVAAGSEHTVGLTSNGTAVAVGLNASGQCNIGDWEDIIQVAAGEQHTVGLTNNGTVVAVGGNDYGQCGVGDWVNIVQVGTGYYHTVGLTSNGTVVAVGLNVYGQCGVGDWEDIIQVAAGEQHTVGLKSDGTVVAVGWNLLGQCDVGDWEDIVQVAGGAFHTVGLKSDSTVVAVGLNNYGQCDVGDWEDIVQVAAGALHTVGLQDNATVIAVGNNASGQCDVGDWEDIIQVAAGGYHTVALKDDGTVAAVGLDDNGQCAVSGWMLN
jgi:NOL1/NOP2/fmu family ribosome biogenesis protein